MIERISAMREQDEAGFTLIELLVVIVILAILAGVVVFAVTGSGDKGRAAAYATDLKTIRTAEESFCAKFGKYGTAQQLVDERFLSERPTYHDVTPTSGGTCNGAGDPSASGFAVACTTAECDTVTVAMSGDNNNKNNLAQWQPPTGVFETLTTMNAAACGSSCTTPTGAGSVGASSVGATSVSASSAGADFALKGVLATDWTVYDPVTAPGSNPSPLANPSGGCTPDTDAACSPFPASHTFRFNIRTHSPGGQRIAFHDGVPLDAWAVKLGLFDRLGRNAFFNPTKMSNPDTGNDSAQVVDNTCTSPATCVLDVTPQTDNLRLLQQLVHPGNQAVESPNQVQFGGTCFHFNPTTHARVTDACTLAANPIGTGPFKFGQYNARQNLTVTRNDAWWQGRALAKTLNFKFQPDPTLRRQMLEGGQADILWDTKADDVGPLRTGGFPVVTPGSPADFQGMFMNLHPANAFDCANNAGATECHNWLTDLNVRKAVAEGIDRNAFVTLYGGQATPAQTLVAPAALGSALGSSPDTTITGFQLNQGDANAKLDTAGWNAAGGWQTGNAPCGAAGTCRKNAGGKELRLTLVYGFPNAILERPLAVFVQSELQKIGIGVDLFEVTATDTYAGRMGNGKGDLFLELATSTDANAAFLPRDIYFWTGPSATYDAAAAQAAFNNYKLRFGPEAPFNGYLNNILSDDGDTARLNTARALHEAIDNQVVVAVLGAVKRLYATRPTVAGWAPHPSFSQVTWNSVAKVAP